jgi:hypothetical protein
MEDGVSSLAGGRRWRDINISVTIVILLTDVPQSTTIQHFNFFSQSQIAQFIERVLSINV